MRLHSKHGLNLTMTTCFFCGETKDILLIGAQVARAKEAGLCNPDGKMNASVGCIDKEPCHKCQECMEQGIILISVKDGDEGDNPYRTGGWVVVKEEAIKRMVSPEELINDIVKKRVAFIPDEAWNMLGLPKGCD